MTRDELIAALEKATGPDHDLDEEIMCCAYADLKLERHMEGWYTPDGTHVRVEPYTYSIDAAASLVPKGWEWCVYGAGGSDVWLPEGLHAQQMTYAATPAIALCIAALKARPE